uniref:Secreted protein n=1 Tax=Theropithecus gelada TaxID=9565 RepID=A0A8D2GCC8_THEGE
MSLILLFKLLLFPVGLPRVHTTSVGGAEHRSAVYSSSVSTNRLDTAQMAIIRYTLTSTRAASGPTAPADARDEAFGAWPLSTSDTNTVAVAVSAGSPWSFTSTRRRWRGASVSSRERVVLISPVYSPTRNGMRALPGSGCSSYESHAL